MGGWPWVIPAVAVPVGSGLMLGVAAFSATRAFRHPPAFRIELSHLLMAIGMVGMLAPRYAVLPAAAWALGFAGMTLWLARHGEHHVMANGAMAFMWGAASVSGGTHGHASDLDVALSVAAAAMLLYLVLRAIRLVRSSRLFSRTAKNTVGTTSGRAVVGRECVMNLTMALMLLPITLGPVASLLQ